MIFDDNWLDTWFFEQFLKRVIGKDRWYFDRSDGVIMVAHGPYVERIREEERARYRDRLPLSNPSRLRVYRHYALERGQIMFFSDRNEFTSHDGRRGFCRAVGKLREFPHFCNSLNVEWHAMEIPKSTELLLSLGDYGEGLGYMHDSNDFVNVINYAREVGARPYSKTK